MKTMYSIAFIITVVIYGVSSYDTFYMENFCSPGKSEQSHRITVGEYGSNSSGLLRATDSLFYSSGLNCSVNLVVPTGYGIVISLRYMELRNFQCQDYIQLVSGASTFTECGPRLNDHTESRSFRFFKNATIRFHTSSSLLGLASGFQLTFTAVKESVEGTCNETEFQCGNNLCIWQGLVCDHHNNCGDKSDERAHGPSHCGYPGYRFSIRGFILSLLSVAVVTTLLLYICRRYRQRSTYVGTVLSSQTPASSAPYGSPSSYGTYGYPAPGPPPNPQYPQGAYPMPPPQNYPPYPPPNCDMPPPPPYTQKATQ